MSLSEFPKGILNALTQCDGLDAVSSQIDASKDIGGVHDQSKKPTQTPTKVPVELEETKLSSEETVEDTIANLHLVNSNTANVEVDNWYEEQGYTDPGYIRVRDWRHKLQKAFLGPNAESMSEAEMQGVDATLTEAESYVGMTVQQLKLSKISKVMARVAALPDAKAPPFDAQFHFRDRARALVYRWDLVQN